MSEDDRLLKDLARAARAELGKELDQRWEALAAGTLSPEEVERLRKEAESSPEAAAKWELFQPLEAQFRVVIAGRVQQSLPAPARRPRAWLRWSLPSALAAAVLVLAFVLPWRRPEALPSYELRVGGAAQSERSEVGSPIDDTKPMLFVTGNRFELLLTPAQSAGAAVEARAFLGEGGRFRPLPIPPPDRSVDGAIRFRGVVGGDVALPEGESTLVVVVGRPGSLPSTSALWERLQHAGVVREPTWAAWRLRLRRGDAP